MKPGGALQVLDAEIAGDAQRLEVKRAVREQLAALYAPAEEPPVRARRAGLKRASRGTSRRAPLAAGSLPDRIVSVLTEHQAPMRLVKLVELVKARTPDVVAARKQLVSEQRIVVVGTGRGTKYSVPKFANVLVADEDAA